jgi:hypothetical protein
MLIRRRRTALSKTPHALADGLMRVFQHPCYSHFAPYEINFICVADCKLCSHQNLIHEKRMYTQKTVLEVGPVFIKKEKRIEAMLFLYFVALMIVSLIERKIRMNMAKDDIEKLPILPQGMNSKKPTWNNIRYLYRDVHYSQIIRDGVCIQAVVKRNMVALKVTWGRLTALLARTSIPSAAPGAPIKVSPITFVLRRFTFATKTGWLPSRNSCRGKKLLLTRTKPPRNALSAVRRETTSDP